MPDRNIPTATTRKESGETMHTRTKEGKSGRRVTLFGGIAGDMNEDGAMVPSFSDENRRERRSQFPDSLIVKRVQLRHGHRAKG